MAPKGRHLPVSHPGRRLASSSRADLAQLARMGAQVVELGPVNATIHKINECVNAADLQLLARMYQRVMEQLVA